jgi:hypothetical protein
MKMIQLRIWLVTLLIAVASSVLAEERRDSIADLDALAAQHSWHELGGHLMDIAPAARDAHWQKLVWISAASSLSTSP